MSHASSAVNMSMTQIQRAGEEKQLILKPRAHNFKKQIFLIVNLKPYKIALIFGSWASQSVKLSNFD